MNATIVVAIVGLLTTLAGTLAAPIVQGRITARNTATARRFDLLVEACVDGMAYINGAQALIKSYLSPDPWPEPGSDYPMDASDITGRLNLLATPDLRQKWHAFTEIYRGLFSQHMTDGGSPSDVITFDNPMVQTMFEALNGASEALREAVGTARRPPRTQMPRMRLATRRAPRL